MKATATEIKTNTRNSPRIKTEEAPFQNLTTYGANFLCHHGANQYVRLKQQRGVKPLKFRGESIYRRNFQNNKSAERILEEARTRVFSVTNNKINKKIL